ncbi:MAG: SDR family NAD(P)-dependent oxidoreductase, partial [Candidatus Binatia bacterium]
MGQVLNRFRLDGRTAIVTGVGPGIGEHVAKAFAEVGANVVCAARTAEKVTRIAGEIGAAGGKAIAAPTDVGRPEELEKLVAAAREAFGPVHIVFNNAATGTLERPGQGPWDNTDELWETAVAVNLLAPHRLTRLVMPDMESHGRGSIITVLSCAGFTPIPPQIAYGSTKAGLLMLTRYLAKICAPHARVNAICPGSMTPDGSVVPI